MKNILPHLPKPHKSPHNLRPSFRRRSRFGAETRILNPPGETPFLKRFTSVMGISSRVLMACSPVIFYLNVLNFGKCADGLTFRRRNASR